MLEKKIYIGSNDVDSNFELRVSSFFKMMQDIAVEHAEQLNVGHAQTVEKGKFWVITRIYLKVNQMPKYRQNVVLKTHPGKTMKFVFPRHFILEDEKGNVLIRAISTWLVLNQSDRRLCLNPFVNNELPYEIHPDELSLPEKIVHGKLDFIEVRRVRYNDIDLNGHLNNTKYIDFILDMHDSNFFKNNVVTSLSINYNHELKDGDMVFLYSNNSNPEYIEGKNGDKNIFDVEIQYKSR